MVNLYILAPEMCLVIFAFLILMADVVFPKDKVPLLHHVGILSACVALGIVGLAFANPVLYMKAGSLWVVDPLALFFKVLLLLSTILVLGMSVEYRPIRPHRRIGTYTGLLLLSAVGMMLLVSATNFLLIFLSLELISISSFILVGFEFHETKSSEGAIKYFLIGAFSSAIMVYGISLFYGAAGTTDLRGIPLILDPGSSVMFIMACLMILVGFGFKVSMAPFHFWVPDAYEGAPTPITTFLSIAPKISALAVMLRVFTHFIPHPGLELTGLFSVLAVLTMTIGNLTAIFQNNIKRMLAYSSIAQAGYMLIGFVTADSLGREGIMIYSLVYVFMNVGAFTVAEIVGNDEGYELEAYDGLAARNWGLSLVMAAFLLSLAGIPPLAGFIAKFYLFAAAVHGGFYGLAVFAVLNSVVSVYYYMRVAYHMFFVEPRTAEDFNIGYFTGTGLVVAALAIFVIGLFPEVFISNIRSSSAFLPAVVALLP